MRNGHDGSGADPGEMALFPTLDEATAERLLAGGGARSADLRRLERLLSAARAPGRYREFAGEDAAVAAFHAARFAPARAEPVRAASGWRRLLTVKAAALAFVVAAGGVAVAAGVTVVAQRPEPGSTPPSAATGDRTTSGTPTTTHPPASPSGANPTVTAGSPANLVGLCHAYLKQHPRPDAHDPQYASLVAAAGGASNVESFCAGLDAQAKRATAAPDPSATPDQAASTHASVPPPSPHSTRDS